jgi:hypothetical protein
MSEPIVLISHLRVREGRLDQLREMSRVGMPRIDEQKPRTLALLGYLNEAANVVSFVHVFADRESFDAHMEGAADRTGAVSDIVEALGFDVYGPVGERQLDTIRAIDGPTIPFNKNPEYIGGWLRLASPGSG